MYIEEELCNESNLAKAKLLTMLQEVGGVFRDQITYNAHIQKEVRRDQALNWFISADSDFEAWCDDAGYHIETVRKKALEIYKNGFPKIRIK